MRASHIGVIHAGMKTTRPESDPVSLFQAVSDETRVRLLRLLRREELNVQELVKILEMNQPRVSKHLAVLRDSGWIRQRKEGTWSWYRAVPQEEFSAGAALCEQVGATVDGIGDAERDDTALAAVLARRDARARDVFADLAGDWDRIRQEYEHQDIQLGALSALVDRSLRVIDIGTGTGALLPLLAAAAGEVVAVDNSAAMLTRARELCRREELDTVRFQHADIQALPFDDASFDAAYCSMVLHHVARPDQALAEMARVVRPGGKVVVIAFTRHDLLWLREELAHRWLGFTREDMEDYLVGAGLRPVRYVVKSRRPRETARGGSRPADGKDWHWPDVFLAVAEKNGH